MAAVTKLLSLQSGVTRAIQSGDTVAATGAWTFADNAVFNAPVLFNGGATGIISENVLIKDPFTVHASDYQVDADRAAGNVFVTRGSTSFSITSVAANKFLTSVDPSATIAPNDFISIANPASPLNLGIFEVASVDAAGVTIKTSPDASVAGIVSQAATNSGAGGTLAKARLSVFRADAAGDQMSVAYGSASPLVFQKMLESNDLSLQTAYEGGDTITLASGDTVSIISQSAAGGFVVDGTADGNGNAIFGNNYLLNNFGGYATGLAEVSGAATNIYGEAIEFRDGQWPSLLSFAKLSQELSGPRFRAYSTLIAQGSIARDATAVTGYTPAIGDVVACVGDASGKLQLADADAADERAHRPLGVVLASDGLSGGAMLIASVSGMLATPKFDTAPASADHGKPVYMSTTAGVVTLTPPTAAGSSIVEIGQLVANADGATLFPKVAVNIRYVAAN